MYTLARYIIYRSHVPLSLFELTFTDYDGCLYLSVTNYKLTNRYIIYELIYYVLHYNIVRVSPLIRSPKQLIKRTLRSI